MSIVSLKYLKEHVKADDFSGDDDYLSELLEESEAQVLVMTRRSAEELKAMNGGEFPLPLRRAILMLAGHWYNQRESAAGVMMHEVPDSLRALTRPWRKLGRDDSREDAI